MRHPNVERSLAKVTAIAAVGEVGVALAIYLGALDEQGIAAVPLTLAVIGGIHGSWVLRGEKLIRYLGRTLLFAVSIGIVGWVFVYMGPALAKGIIAKTMICLGC
jgi:hypothetical protein